MALQCDTENVHALNWRVYFVDHLGLGEYSFNDVCYLIINEFSEADVIRFERNECIIKIHFPVSYSYIDVMRKLERCRYQILIDIDCEEETKDIIGSSRW